MQWITKVASGAGGFAKLVFIKSVIVQVVVCCIFSMLFYSKFFSLVPSLFFSSLSFLSPSLSVTVTCVGGFISMVYLLHRLTEKPGFHWFFQLSVQRPYFVILSLHLLSSVSFFSLCPIPLPSLFNVFFLSLFHTSPYSHQCLFSLSVLYLSLPQVVLP